MAYLIIAVAYLRDFAYASLMTDEYPPFRLWDDYDKGWHSGQE